MEANLGHLFSQGHFVRYDYLTNQAHVININHLVD